MIWNPKFLTRKTASDTIDLHWASNLYTAQLDARLVTLGFERTGKRLWVNSETMPFRKVVQFTAIRGATDSLLWGYSFDFCPLTDNQMSKLIWARTPKSARPMLIYDPIDFWDEKKRDWRICAFSSLRENNRNFQRLFEASQDWFSRIVSLEDIVKEFDDWQARPAIRFQYSNYIFAPLAHAFCLAKYQQMVRAIERFTFWSEQYKPKQDVLNKLIELLRKQSAT